ncbi:MAG TPA: hypothetical protein VIT41_04215 [Microlunatus sp.]
MSAMPRGTDMAGRGMVNVGQLLRERHVAGNYVSTRMGERYDALLWFEQTTPCTLCTTSPARSSRNSRPNPLASRSHSSPGAADSA